MSPLSVTRYSRKILFMEIFTFIPSLIRLSQLHCADKMQDFVILKQVVRVVSRVAEMFLK